MFIINFFKLAYSKIGTADENIVRPRPSQIELCSSPSPPAYPRTDHMICPQ